MLLPSGAKLSLMDGDRWAWRMLSATSRLSACRAPDTTRHVTLLAGGDKADAGALIFEWSRQRKDLPSSVLALVLVCWWSNPRCDRAPPRWRPHRHCGDRGIGGRIDHPYGVGAETCRIGTAAVRRDGDALSV